MEETFAWYLGIDWGMDQHQFCLIDATGRIHAERAVAHTTIAIHEALEGMRQRANVPSSQVAIALETPRGALVDTALDLGFRLFAVNPKQLDRFRDRFSAAGVKDDRLDARVAADARRTDPHAFREIRAEDPAILTLRELSRMLDDLQTEHGRLVNRLREQLYRVHAPWLVLSPAANHPWLWTILREATHPDSWSRLSRQRIASVLRTHRVRRVSVDTVLDVLRQPRLTIAPGVADAVALRIGTLIPQVQLLHEQRTATERHIDRALAQLATTESAPGQPTEHRDAEIFLSLPGVGRVVAATMLTEGHGPLAARDYPTLRGQSGVAPVTKRSGKRLHRVHMRYACKPRLREALYHWARTSLQHDTAARAYYDRLRQRGHSHGRALRSVGDRWLRILIAMLRTSTLYDPGHFAPHPVAA